jgi:hypothetical protein
MYNVFTPILKWFCSETELKYFKIIKDGRIDCYVSNDNAPVFRVFVGSIKFMIAEDRTTIVFLSKTDDDTEQTKTSWAFYKLIETLYDDRRVVIARQARIDEARDGLALYDEVVAELTKYSDPTKTVSEYNHVD